MKEVVEPFNLAKAINGALVKNRNGNRVSIIKYNLTLASGSNMILGIEHCSNYDNVHIYNSDGKDTFDELHIVTFKRENSISKKISAFRKLLQVRPHPKYGREIDDNDWDVTSLMPLPAKHIICRNGNRLEISNTISRYHTFAFYTKEQAELYLKENERLLKAYFDLI